MEDINYNEVFGIEAESANETEVAEPSTDTDTEGAKESEAAETTVEGETEVDTEEAPEQKAEERSKYAAARRKAEAEKKAEIDRIRADAQKEIDSAISSLGITDPRTGKRVSNKAEYDTYMKQRSEEQKSRIVEESGVSNEEFEEFISNLPEVREAREQIAKAKEAETKARDEQARIHIEEEIKAIGKYDPTIKSIDDLLKLDTYDAVYEKVQKGYSLSDAYVLANHDKIVQDTVNKTKQAVINSANGKNHMTPTTHRGEGAVSVPSDVKEAYRMFNPDATDAEIARHYNKYLNK